MSPLVWTGIATAAVLALAGLWAWLWPRPRVTSKSFAAHLDDDLDVIAEPDRRRAEHMNRTLRRAEGGDEV